MKKIEYKSQCCNAPVKVDGLPDFEGYTCTTYYVCTKCNEACDVIGTKKNLLARFLDAIVVNAKEHPENLYTSKEVWDEEWDVLLKGIKEMNKKLGKTELREAIIKVIEEYGREIKSKGLVQLNTKEKSCYVIHKEDFITALLPIFAKYAVSLVEVDVKSLRKKLLDWELNFTNADLKTVRVFMKDLAHILAISNIIKGKE